ncbi:MAG: DinB family protein [Bacteroidota bacterium]
MKMQKWIEGVDQRTQQFQAHFATLNAEQLNWKPNPETWSIAQNIDHLIVINSTYFPVIDQLIAGTYRAPFIARIGFMVRLMGDAILKGSSADRSRKIKTFPIWEPASSKLSGDILNQFVDHQKKLKAYILKSAPLVGQAVVISSPANKNIVYSLAKAFDIIVAHEERHLEQAKEILGLQGTD